MRAFFARPAIIIGVFNLPFIWRGAVWLTDWMARFDFWNTHGVDLMKAGKMIGVLSNPPPWLIFITLPLAVAIVLWDARHPHTLGAIRSTVTASKNRMLLFVCLSITCLLLSGGFGFAAYWQYKHPAPPEPKETALFKAARDSFQHTGGFGKEVEDVNLPQIRGQIFPVTVWIRSDLISMATYLVFYVPSMLDMPKSPNQPDNFPTRQTFEVLKQMADRFDAVMKRANAKGNAGIGDAGGENFRYSTEAPFNGAIYAYYEGRLTEDERVELRAIYAQHHARIFFRDNRYLIESTAKH